METVIISQKYQVVIPRSIRQPLGIQPGQKFQMIAYQDSIVLLPIKPVEKMRGFLKGIDTTIER